MRMLFSFAMLTLCACGGPQAPPQPAAAAAPTPAAPAQAAQASDRDEPTNPAFIGRVWRSTERSSPLGSIIVFLPDRTLLMDSCFETYRISKWGAAGDRIRWIEDTIPIEATVSMQDDNNLRLQIVGQDNVQSYVTATVPYVCPDMPR